MANRAGGIVESAAAGSAATRSGRAGAATSALSATASYGATLNLARYRMRALNGAAYVFWNAPIIDTTGAFYTGTGSLTSIVVRHRIYY
jgi:hypothetical protein